MQYLDLNIIKKQLRIDDYFTEDDELLESLGDAAEDFLENHLDTSLDDITAENGGELPKSLYQALLILTDYFYDNSGSGEVREIPQAFWILSHPFRKYTVK